MVCTMQRWLSMAAIVILVMVGISTIRTEPSTASRWNAEYHLRPPIDMQQVLDLQKDLLLQGLPRQDESPSPAQADSQSVQAVDIPKEHHKLTSSRRDGTYYPIIFGSQKAMNPSILPHPTEPDTYIILSQARHKARENHSFTGHAYCNATFTSSGELACTSEPTDLNLAVTTYTHCTSEVIGPRTNIEAMDAKIFSGPEGSYISFGSQSKYTCFGQWTQDLSSLIPSISPPSTNQAAFKAETEIRRPKPWSLIEKDFFLFWDTQNKTYAHYQTHPKRLYAQISPSNGTVVEEMTARAANPGDGNCWKKHMKAHPLQHKEDTIRQASNSLRVSLCDFSDSFCQGKEGKELIMSVFQHEGYGKENAAYVMVYQADAPFEMRGVSRKPLKISRTDNESEKDMNIVSLSWKDTGRGYHGYLDDLLLVNFGVGESKGGVIDVTAKELLAGMEWCD